MIYSKLIEKWNKQGHSIEINHLLVLCEIGDDYPAFCEELEQIVKTKGNRDLIQKAYHIMQGKKTIGGKKIKEFKKNHQHSIDIMNKYSCLSDFTVLSFYTKGERRENLSEDFFYQYLKEHQEDINKIIALAKRLKELGFTKLTFGENLDFTQDEYELDTSYNTDFVFLENIDVNPTYLTCPIKYKSTSSVYCIYLNHRGYGLRDNIEDYRRDIILNSLTFDINRLPSEITKETTVNKIRALAQEKKNTYKVIKDSVDFSISAKDIKNEYDKLALIATRINNSKNNEELKDLMSQMQAIIAKLQSFGVDYEQEIITSHPSITSQIMEEERKLLLQRRYYSSLDID